MRVVVVGSGIMGLSAAWALLRDGHDVAIIDQSALPNPAGSSNDQHRLIRYPYGASLGYTKMVSQAYGAWEEVWRDVGEHLYAQTGTLVVCRGSETWSGPSAATLEEAGIGFERVGLADAAARFDYLVWNDATGALYLESGGTLFASRIVEALLRWLRAKGADVRSGTRVAEIDESSASVKVESGGAIRGNAVVVAAGAWITKLLPRMRERLAPSRQIAVYLEPPKERERTWATGPMVLDLDGGLGLYVVPPAQGTRLKIGDHRFTKSGDPSAARGASAAEAADVVEKCGGLIADLGRYRIAQPKDCFYTVASQERFVVERTSKTWLVSACSGHGFKFGPIIGKAVAQGIAEKRDAAEIAAWAAGAA